MSSKKSAGFLPPPLPGVSLQIFNERPRKFHMGVPPVLFHSRKIKFRALLLLKSLNVVSKKTVIFVVDSITVYLYDREPSN